MEYMGFKGEHLWHSASAIAICSHRMASQDGRINRILGRGKPFSPEYKDFILGNGDEILYSKYLEKDLRAAKVILNALDAHPEMPGSAKLKRKLLNGHKPGIRSVMCPLSRWRRLLAMTVILGARYFHDASQHHLYHVTIVDEFAPDLFALKEVMQEFQRKMTNVAKGFTRKCAGIVFSGVLEPDLRTATQISEMHLLSTLRKERGWQVSDHGGWVLSGHFVVRAHKLELLEKELRSAFPSADKSVVRIERLTPPRSSCRDVFVRKDTGEIQYDTFGEALQYFYKYEEWLYDAQSWEKLSNSSDAGFVGKVFMGPSLAKCGANHKEFKRNHAIAQWAIFMDQIGEDLVFFDLESAWAQRWYSDLEELSFKERLMDDLVSGYVFREVFRGYNHYQRKPDPYSSQFQKNTRTRRIVHDDEWLDRYRR